VNHINEIKQICEKAAKPLSEVSIKGVKSYRTFDIDCQTLEEYDSKSIETAEKFKELFSQLKTVTGPVLYWFEIVSSIDNQLIINELDKYRNSEDCKAVPALKSNLDFNTKALYVGKVKQLFRGRLIQHLGYQKGNKTQGLQLYYWTKSLPLKFKLHVYEFDNDIAELMSIVENAMAKELKPLIGKHK